MKCKGDDTWEPKEEDIIVWQRNFPKVDVHLELKKMDSWCEFNPKNRKTKGGMYKFANGWIARAKELGGQSPANIGKQAQVAKLDPKGISVPQISLKSMTADMELTDISWLDGDDYLNAKEHYLSVYGFYFNGELRNA
tara:strand:+ start:221 stop:634 length:414 start_codon:yes stop_codon:yes gene_type:complete